MSLIKTKNELSARLSSLPKKNGLGLVPTMGALHQGHVSLVEKAIAENDFVVVSIFVNPTQFDNTDDLHNYPKTLEADRKLLYQISKDIIIFAPSVKEVYATAIMPKSYNFEGLDKVMEGQFREDHFNGVATIVEELLTLVRPTKAYFGEKDFQQLQIIKKLVEIRNISVGIIGCPIVREANGLAMSSRNARLTETQREKASYIFKILKAAKVKFGTESAKYVMDWVKDQFKNHPDLQLEYIEIADVHTLTPVLKKQRNGKYRAFVAVYINGVRLIDNIALC